MYWVTWSVGAVISNPVLARFVSKISWVDIEWQSKLKISSLSYVAWSYGSSKLLNLVGFIFVSTKSAGVRKSSVLALQNLYDVEDNVPSLNLFTERFYKRMLELADDIDISVSVCAIGLVKQLLRYLWLAYICLSLLLNFDRLCG